jgi:hypothetical protein
MRVSSFSAFINQAHPPIEPYTLSAGGAFGVPAHLRGRALVGNTITCSPPKLGGAGIKVRYDWQVEAGNKNPHLAGQHQPKLTVTRAMFNRADEAKRILCVVTASNKGGNLVMNSGSIHMSRG